MSQNENHQQKHYSPISTDHDQIHSRTLEEFPEGPYGSPLLTEQSLGKESSWETGEHINPRFSYENKNLHQDLPRLDPAADPIRYDDAKDETIDNTEEDKQ